MDVNECISYECSDEGTCTPTIHNSYTRSHASEGENRTRNHSKKCKCKRVLTILLKLIIVVLLYSPDLLLREEGQRISPFCHAQISPMSSPGLHAQRMLAGHYQACGS
jgi:hypothetical protein